MNKYAFGDPKNPDQHIIEAKNVEVAIKLYKVKELFPEQHVYSKDVINFDYDNELKRYIKNFKDNPKIPVYLFHKDKKNTYIQDINLREVVNVDYTDLIPRATTFLEAPDNIIEPEPEIKLPVVGNANTIKQYNKIELRQKHDQINRMKADLERQRWELVEAMNVLNKELKQKATYIYMIETFLGVNEEVYQLASGQSAPEKEPLYLYQEVLYMDEEVGIWDDQGIDYTQIDIFDNWIKDNVGKFLYKEKAVCVFQVRRERKDYGNAWANQQNVYNRETYFLIKNGENLFRIFSNVQVINRLFPTLTEYDEIFKDDWNKNDPERIKEAVNKKIKQYMYGMLAIQGLIERTDIFGVELRNHVNLTAIKEIPEDKIVLVRDAEQGYWIGEGRLTWYEFLAKNRELIKVGTRIIISGLARDYKSTNSHRFKRFYFNEFSAPAFPTQNAVYIVEELEGGAPWISYLPQDEIYKGYDCVSRKNKVRFKLYGDEVLNFDDITLEDCEYYQHNRYERKHYLELLPTLHYIRTQKLAENALEAEFVKLVAGQLRWDESRYAEIEEAIKWWKLKNKWKRPLTKDEAKALRMILKKLK